MSADQKNSAYSGAGDEVLKDVKSVHALQHCSAMPVALKEKSKPPSKSQNQSSKGECGLCAATAVFHSALLAGLIALPPPSTPEASHILAPTQPVSLKTLPQAFAARAPPHLT